LPHRFVDIAAECGMRARDVGIDRLLREVACFSGIRQFRVGGQACRIEPSGHSVAVHHRLRRPHHHRTRPSRGDHCRRRGNVARRRDRMFGFGCAR
jgi:hypothetical protein